MVCGSWKMVLRQVDRLYTEGASAGWNHGQLLSRFQARRVLVVLFVLALGTGSARLVATQLGPSIDRDARRLVRKSRPPNRLRNGFHQNESIFTAIHSRTGPSPASGRTDSTMRTASAEWRSRPTANPSSRSHSLMAPHESGTLPRAESAQAIEVEALQGGRNFTLLPDGTSLLGAERDYSRRCMFRIWDLKTGRERRRQTLPEVPGFMKLAYSPDGKILATLLSDSTVVLWDVMKLGEIRRLRSQQLNLGTIAFSPNSHIMAITYVDILTRILRGQGQTPPIDPSREKPSVWLWDVESGREIRKFPIEGADACSVAFSPDGMNLAASFFDGTIRLFDPAKGEELARLKVEGRVQNGIAFSPDGTILASISKASNDATGPAGGFMIEAAAGKASRKMKRHAAALHFWDVTRRTEVHRWPAPDLAEQLVFSPDGKTLAAGLEKTIWLWDITTGRELFRSSAPRSSVACLVVSPTDGSVITGGYDNAIRRWDPTTGRELGVVGTHPDPVYDLATTSDGRFLLSSSLDATVRLWDMGGKLESSRLMAVDHESRGRGLAFSGDGQLTTAGGKIWEVATGRELATLQNEEGKPFRPWASAAFTLDAKGLVATNGGAIWLFDVATGRTVRQIAAPGFQISSIALSPDGRFLASGVNHSVRLWHLATGREIKQSMGHEAKVGGAPAEYVTVAFSSDGRLLVSGSGGDFYGNDPSVRVWEVASGHEVRRFNGHRAGVYAVAFFADGHRIASASADATAMVWDLSASDQAARSHPPRSMNADQLWTELATDANRAYRAIWTLVASPELAVPLLSDRLKPIQSDDPDKDTSIGPIATGETLRRLRAIAVLEKIGTPERAPSAGAAGDGARWGTRDPRCQGRVAAIGVRIPR